MSEQNIVNVMVIPDVPKVLPGEQLYVYVPKASFTFPGIIAYNNTQFRIDGNFLFIREDYVSPGVTQKIDELKQYTDDKLQLKQDKEDDNISLAQRPEQKSVVGAINDLGTLTQEAKNAADHAQSTADNATTLANTGISKAEQAQQTADNAQQAADAAQATADNATTLANTGISKADQAQTTANTAVDKANDAKATANEAIMKADGRSNSIGFMTAKDAVTALNGYPRTQLKGGDTIWIVETGTPDLWVTEVAQESVPYNYTTKDKFNQDLVDNKVLQIGYFKTAYQESDGKPVTIAWQNVLVKSTDWVASTEFADFPYEAKIELTDFVDYTTVPQVVFDIADTMSGNYAPICKSGDKCVYIYSKVQNEITLKTVITFAPNVNGASITGGGYNNRGKWQASTTYEIDDLVYTDNGQYVCIDGITSTTSPEQDTQHWQATFIATGKTKNGLKFSGQDNGTGVQKTFDGSTPVEVSFDETTMTTKEVDGVLKVGAKGTIPEALPQTAEALKSGNLPTSGWVAEIANIVTTTAYLSSSEMTIIAHIDANIAKLKTGWEITLTGDNQFSGTYYNQYSSGQKRIVYNSAITGGKSYTMTDESGNARFHLEIYDNGEIKMDADDRNSEGTYGISIKNTTYSQWSYTISDTSITANSDILMELTDEGGVKSHAIANGSITVIRDAVPTQPIPYTYKVKQTNAAGQFTLVNHYVPESPTDLPVTYKKASGELPTTGWSQLGWEQSTLPAARHWSCIAYGKGKFVTIAGNGSDKGAYSADGINWTEMTMPSAELWNGIAYGNGKFVAVATSTDKGAYSVDGINWTLTTMPSSPGYKDWIGVAYGNGKFVTLTLESSYCAYSNDGITWTATTLPTKRNWRRIAYGNDKFVAIAKGTDKGAYSTDGVTWTEMTLPASRNWQGITYGEDKFIAIAGSSDKGAYSTDGINWTEMTLPESRDWYCTAYGNGKFVAIEYNGLRAAYSTDGITWLSLNTPIIRSWCGVVYGDNKFVVVSRDASVSSQNNKALYWEVDSKFTYTISDTFITTNTSVKMYLTDEGGVKALRRANGSITVLRGMVPTTVIPYEYEVKQTSTSGLFEVINAYIPDVPTVPTKTSQLENDSNFAKTNTPNSWGSTQTFTAYDGIKTNRICNAAGTSLVDGTGTENKFGNVNTPTIIRTREARPKAEVPYADGTAKREIALLEDIPSMVIDWVGPSATEQVITGTGMRQIFAEFTDTVGDVSTLYKFYGEVYVDGQNEVNGTSSTVYSTNTEGTELHVITVTPTIRRNTDNQFVLRAECCRYTIGASPMSINKSYLSFVFRKRLY